MAAKSRPSATSCTVKSNSLRGHEVDRRRVAQRLLRLHRHLGADSPTLSAGFSAFSASATFTSEAKEGVEVCSTARS